jgi:hypothetical protein
MSCKSFQSENMTFAVIGLLILKLTYDGILQLQNCLEKLYIHRLTLKSEQLVLIPVVSS